jgi:Arc/MetJ-type ribon-helix-helix transcriptional regulator
MTARFTVSLPASDLARIDELAAEQGISRSELVREATGRYMAASEAASEADERRGAGTRLVKTLAEWDREPLLDERPSLEILRELRGPLESRQAWDDSAEDLP